MYIVPLREPHTLWVQINNRRVLVFSETLPNEVRLNSLEAKMERLTEGNDIVFCLHDFSSICHSFFFVTRGDL